MKNDDLKKKKSFLYKIKRICSIPVKNEGRALNIIFVLCLICIVALSIFIYRTMTGFYQEMEEKMQNNINLNIETMQNEQMEYIHSILDNI